MSPTVGMTVQKLSQFLQPIDWRVCLALGGGVGAIAGNNPAASAVVVFLILSFIIADRYFSLKHTDGQAKAILNLQNEFAKLKTTNTQETLRGAFERRSGGPG